MVDNNYDHFVDLKGQIVRIDTELHQLPIFGRIIAISSQFITIQRKDGRLTLIRRKAILAIETVRNQGSGAV